MILEPGYVRNIRYVNQNDTIFTIKCDEPEDPNGNIIVNTYEIRSVEKKILKFQRCKKKFFSLSLTKFITQIKSLIQFQIGIQ